MKYLDYRGMKEYYTIDEVCRLFEISRQELRHYAGKYSIQPQEDQYGNWGFRKVLVRKLHNFIYKTTRQQVRKMIANEELPAVKVGREWRVLKAGIMEFFETNL